MRPLHAISYRFTERIEELPPTDIEVAGIFAVFEDGNNAVRKWDERVGACRWLVGGPSRHLGYGF